MDNIKPHISAKSINCVIWMKSAKKPVREAGAYLSVRNCRTNGL